MDFFLLRYASRWAKFTRTPVLQLPSCVKQKGTFLNMWSNSLIHLLLLRRWNLCAHREICAMHDNASIKLKRWSDQLSFVCSKNNSIGNKYFYATQHYSEVKRVVYPRHFLIILSGSKLAYIFFIQYGATVLKSRLEATKYPSTLVQVLRNPKTSKILSAKYISGGD